jgi:hypothetical protein
MTGQPCCFSLTVDAFLVHFFLGVFCATIDSTTRGFADSLINDDREKKQEGAERKNGNSQQQASSAGNLCLHH